jgi:hypothetical protein
MYKIKPEKDRKSEDRIYNVRCVMCHPVSQAHPTTVHTGGCQFTASLLLAQVFQAGFICK